MGCVRRFASAAIICFAAFTPAGCAAEEQHCPLELVRIDAGVDADDVPLGLMLQNNVSPQSFFMQVRGGVSRGDDVEGFKKAVKKEPEKYVAKYPLRGLATLGSKQYGFVLDKISDKSDDFDRLYFDLNGNGDLTDDRPIDKPPPKQAEKPSGFWSWLVPAPRAREESEFPRVDLTIDVDGKKLDYSFYFQANGWSSGDNQYVWASLTPAVYRRGTIELDGKKWRVVALDHNSNGRFDDAISLPKNVRGSGGELMPSFGDMLLFQPQLVADADGKSRYHGNASQQYVSAVTAVEGKYYRMKVSPLGDELTWAPASIERGQVSSPHAPCIVVLIGELGYLELQLDGKKPAAVPVGKWRVLSYNIVIENWKDPAKKDEDKADKKDDKPKPSLLEALAESLFGGRSRSAGRQQISMVYASGTVKGEWAEVRAGQTTTLKFGPPYKLRVAVDAVTPGVAHLSLNIQGADNENVAYMLVNGDRPPKPKLTITDPQGKVVAEGDFEYG